MMCEGSSTSSGALRAPIARTAANSSGVRTSIKSIGPLRLSSCNSAQVMVLTTGGLIRNRRLQVGSGRRRVVELRSQAGTAGKINKGQEVVKRVGDDGRCEIVVIKRNPTEEQAYTNSEREIRFGERV